MKLVRFGRSTAYHSPSIKVACIKTHKKFFLEQTFKHLDWSSQQIISSEFDNCTFKNCNFTEASFSQCKFINCEFTNCNLSLVAVKDSNFFEVIFQESKLVGINWAELAWSNIRLPCTLKFIKCNLNHSVFMGLYLREIVIEDCMAHEVDFREADLAHANFSGTEFDGSHFNQTNLTEADFTEATNYTIDVFSNKLKRAKFSLPEALNLLHSLEIKIDGFSE